MSLLRHAVCFLLFLKQGLAMQPGLEIQSSCLCKDYKCAPHTWHAGYFLVSRLCQQEWEGVEMKRDSVTSPVRFTLNRFGGRCPSWNGLPHLLWRSLGRITLAVMNLQMPTRCLGGRCAQSSGIRKSQVSVQLFCWLPRECRGSTPSPSPFLEKLPQLEKAEMSICS